MWEERWGGRAGEDVKWDLSVTSEGFPPCWLLSLHQHACVNLFDLVLFKPVEILLLEVALELFKGTGQVFGFLPGLESGEVIDTVFTEK